MENQKLTMNYMPLAVRWVSRYGTVRFKGKECGGPGLVEFAGLRVSIENGQVGRKGREWQPSDPQGIFARYDGKIVCQLKEGRPAGRDSSLRSE